MSDGEEKNKISVAVWGFWGSVIAAIIAGLVTLIVADKIPWFSSNSDNNSEKIFDGLPE